MPIRAFPSMLTALIISGCAIVQPTKPDEDHSAHHPPEGAPAVAASQPASAGAPSTQAYELQMKAMQEMHLKMRAAKTPAERGVLMNEHMKLMQAGISMMGSMGGPGSQSPQAGMGMMPSPSTSAGTTAAPSASGPGMQGMAGMMNMHKKMERRMAMMEQMMQMMVDREAAVQSK